MPDERDLDERHVPERFRHIPDPVRLEDTNPTTDADPARDPYGGRDPEKDFVLRWASLGG